MNAMTRICCWFALAALGAGSPAQSVQFADGRVLLVEVDPGSVDGQGMRVRRLDNGGSLDLRWEHLSAASAQEWRRRFDLAGDSQGELLMLADEVQYEVEGSPKTLLGRITERLPDAIVVQVRGQPWKVRRGDVRGVRKVEAPVAQILTKEEFYVERLGALQPGGDADKHVLLAEDLVKMRDYERAEEHLRKAKELGNSRNPQQIDVQLQRLARYKEAARELKVLEEIQAARSRGQLVDFEKGRRLIAQFEKEFPASKLKSEFDAEKRRFDAARARFLTQQVADRWRDAIRVVAEKALSDRTMTLQQARDYAENRMSDDIVARLTTLLRIDAEEVKKLWGERKAIATARRTEHFSYGIGSWVLGSAAILKDTATGREIDKQKGGGDTGQAGDPNADRFARMLKQALERRRQAVQASPTGQREQTEEDWWRQAQPAERVGWLRAYYAEFGGQLVVTFATVSPCLGCHGEGTVPEMAPDGNLVRNKCFLCQNTKWVRSFKAY
jgi:tetratricopeptide (TPR) repeat protein